MILYFLILISLIAVGEAAWLVIKQLEVNAWREKYADVVAKLLPWDYTREEGWR